MKNLNLSTCPRLSTDMVIYDQMHSPIFSKTSTLKTGSVRWWSAEINLASSLGSQFRGRVLWNKILCVLQSCSQRALQVLELDAFQSTFSELKRLMRELRESVSCRETDISSGNHKFHFIKLQGQPNYAFHDAQSRPRGK